MAICFMCNLRKKVAGEMTKKASTEAGDIFICHTCNNLVSRCNRLKEARGMVSFGFENMEPERRAQWMIENQSKYKDALAVQMQEVATQGTRASSLVQFKGIGDWLDYADLEEKYRKKPERFKNIIETHTEILGPSWKSHSV